VIRFFVDTSGWYAFINARDRDHERVIPALRDARKSLVTSNFVFDELITLCRYRLGHSLATKAGRILLESGAAEIIRITPADEQEAWALFLDREDKEYSFTDCTSFALMRRLRLDRVIAVDEDFAREGFDVAP
jgi:predicted nucleic acid-binding protein